MDDKSIVILAGVGESTNIVFNALSKGSFDIARVILEDKTPLAQFLQKRIRKLGLVKTIGQVLFKAIVVTLLARISRKRIAHLKRSLNLDDTPIEEWKISRVKSVNSSETIRLLQDIKPAAIVVNGTRIISGNVLSCVSAKFLNMHVGITPLYRGVHGAYWALVNGRRDMCGVTVHLVETGIDTGNILGQARINPAAEDNFVTYPLLQVAMGLPILKESLQAVLENRIVFKPCPEGASKLWSHPTIWEYTWHRIRQGVK